MLTSGWRAHELRRVGVAATVVATLAVAVVASTLLRSPSISEASAPVPAPPPDSADPTTVAASSPPEAHETLPASVPTHLDIPSVGVDTTSIMSLGLTPAGVAEVPGHARAVGWLSHTATPGARGAAVLTGHTALSYERGAFFALSSLRPGDLVKVTRADGTVAVFTVYRVEELPEASAAEHAGQLSRHPDLRLLTTASPDHATDRATVVSARLTATR